MAKASVTLQNGAVHWTVIRDGTDDTRVASLALAVAFAVLKFGNRERRSEGKGKVTLHFPGGRIACCVLGRGLTCSYGLSNIPGQSGQLLLKCAFVHLTVWFTSKCHEKYIGIDKSFDDYQCTIRRGTKKTDVHENEEEKSSVSRSTDALQNDNFRQ